MRGPFLIALFLSAILNATPTVAADGNRLTYLDGSDPYYVSRTFPKLITPQWIGEEGVEAVVILAIDDMRGHEKWETFLRPILRRLQQIDGRAPVSIMTCQVDPNDPHLQVWLKEGLSLETHTIDHPCPLLQGSDFAKAKSTCDRCVDLMNAVPNNKPVAFRVPCCDSLNTPSPRFFAEIFNKTTPKGNWLSIDSSVFNIITSNDPDLPRGLVIDSDGQEKFRKYIPADRSFVNTIEDYPYPYVIGRLCWEFPCVTPSDWQANHYHKPNNPITVRDWKAALDATVLKQGVFTMVFHPHGWIKNEQIVDLIDYAANKYGKKVKFLTFREALERLNKNLLAGQPLRGTHGEDNGVRLVDLNNDGFVDVVIGNDKERRTRLWSPESKSWIDGDFPVRFVETVAGGRTRETGVQFGELRPDGQACFLIHNEEWAGVWQFDGKKWISTSELLAGLELDGQAVATNLEGRDQGVRFRDLDKDGRCELIVSNDQQQAIFAWSPEKKKWTKLSFALPSVARIVDEDGKDNGVRFVDVDEDGYEDVIFSNDKGCSLNLFRSMKEGWGRNILGVEPSAWYPSPKEGAKPIHKPAHVLVVERIPFIVRSGTNYGAWFHSRHLWVQNENTALLKDHVDRRSFNQLLEKVEPTAKSPEASLHSWRPRPGFEVELMAAEPLVQSPIAFAWGPDGKFWVVEMGDYPNGVDGKGKPGGRIKFLEDTKGTGKYDKATVFLDNLSFPTSVMPWRKGVIVTCAPDIFYAEDTDGDGKADLRVPLFTGFEQGNPQHRANGLVWGLDNWIYGANGDSGGAIKSVKTGKAVNISGRDYRFRPDDGSFEAETGQTQFGRCRDDWGNWFGCNNSEPMYHFVLADHYLKRNPHLPSPNPRVQVSVTPGAAPVFPASRTLPRFNDPWAANRFTSACGVIVYRDELFGPAFANNSFVSEPVHNLVHREIMSARGVTFTSKRAADEQNSEFLASSDNWTRPTTIQTGPDGALWVADMYRQVIEHPEWIPEEWQKRLDLRAGHDKGRIYRVYPVGKKPRPIPRLDRLSTAELVAALDSADGWQRDLAQQLLIQRQDPEAVGLLEKQATGSPRALCRLHALCTLDGLNSLRPAVLEKELTDTHAGVRRHAVRLCEARLKEFLELATALAKLVDDPDAQVRLQLACSLGEWDDPRAGQALGRLAIKDGNDPYLLAAIMSSVNEKNLDEVIPILSVKNKRFSVPRALTENLLRMAIALGHRRGLATLLSEVGKKEDGRYASWQLASLASVLDALDQLNSSLPKLAEEGDADLKRAVNELEGLFEAARAVVADPKAGMTDQLEAIPLLGRDAEDRQKDIEMLAGLLSPQAANELQSAAATALGRIQDPLVPQTLLKGWKAHSPGLRGLVLDILSRREEWVKAALDAVDHKQILPFEVDAPRRQKLLQHRNPQVRERAAQLLASAVNSDRQKVLAEYRPGLTMKGDAAKGREIFKKNCATCHRYEGIGQQVGPDIASVGDKSPESLMIAILDPNRAVEARYVSYLATTKNGVTYTGVLTNETGISITLIGTEGKPQTLLRKDLDDLASTGKSLMPEGLEKEIQPPDLADLIAFLRAGVPEPKRKTVEGNQPELVSALGDGTLRLYPSNCEIYGAEITLEKANANLGMWTGPEDRALWTITIPKPGKFAVRLEWACADESAGNSYLLQIGDSKLSGAVPGTGTWQNYQRAKIGEVTLPVGKHQVVFRSQGKIKGALIDLKEVRLIPLKK